MEKFINLQVNSAVTARAQSESMNGLVDCIHRGIPRDKSRVDENLPAGTYSIRNRGSKPGVNLALSWPQPQSSVGNTILTSCWCSTSTHCTHFNNGAPSFSGQVLPPPIAIVACYPVENRGMQVGKNQNLLFCHCLLVSLGSFASQLCTRGKCIWVSDEDAYILCWRGCMWYLLLAPNFRFLWCRPWEKVVIFK